MINSHGLVPDTGNKTSSVNSLERRAEAEEKLALFSFLELYNHIKSKSNLVRYLHHRRSPFVKFICPIG